MSARCPESSIRQRRSVTSIAALLTLAPLAWSAPQSGAPASEHRSISSLAPSGLVVGARTDAAEAIFGQRVSIAAASGKTYDLITDELGYAEDLAIDLDQPLAITFEETPTPRGTTVGQTLPFERSALPDLASADSLGLEYYLPEARPVRFDPALVEIHDGLHDRWHVRNDEGPAVGYDPFQASVATLLTGDLINAYFGFRGMDPPIPTDGDAVAILLRVDESADLGVKPLGGLAVSIDVTGHREITDVATFYFGADPRGNGITAEPRFERTRARVGMDGSQSGIRTEVLVQGELHRGDNLIVLGNAASFEWLPGSWAYADLSSGHGSRGSGGRHAQCGGAGNCEPPAPDTNCYDGQGCDPKRPVDECGEEDLVSTSDKSEYHKIGPRLCVSAGGSLTAQRCLGFQGGLAISIGIPIGGGGASGTGLQVGANGQVTGSVCISMTCSGGGQARCCQAWQCVWVRTRVWEKATLDKRTGHCTPNGTQTTSCQVPGPQVETECSG